MTEQLMAISQPSNIQSSPLAMYHTIRIDDALEDMQDWIPSLQVIESAQAGDTLHFKYNCVGGRADIMNAFLSAMEQTEANIVSELVGNACSAASIMFLRGDSFIVNRYAEYMAHCPQYYTGGSEHHIKQRVAFTSSQSNKLIREEYKHFLTPEEIDGVVSGQEVYLNADDIIERLEKRQALFVEESGEFEPDPIAMQEWSKERLLSFMFDEEYDNGYWEDVEKAEEGVEEQEQASLHLDKVLDELSKLSDYITAFDNQESVVFNDNVEVFCDGRIVSHLTDKSIIINSCGCSELKQIADDLGVPYKNNATQKVVAKLILDFVGKVVDILNS